MVPWNHSSIQKSLFEEVESINDIDALKKIAKTLITENTVLSRRTNTILKSLENQNNLINYLQDTLVVVMNQNKQQARELFTIIATETLRTFDNAMRYQMILCNWAHKRLPQSEKRILKELFDAAYTVPYKTVEVARNKCAKFLLKLKNDVQGERHTQHVRNVETQDTAQQPRIEFQNSRMNSLGKNRKQHYRIKAKRNACRTSRKHSLNKIQNNRSASNDKKISMLANLDEASQSDNAQSKNFPKRRRFKRKADEINDVSPLKSDTENSAPVNKTPVNQTEPTKKMRSNSNVMRSDSISESVNESIKLKPFVIELNDFMIDPTADNEYLIAQYKQANSCKINEEEFQIVDDVDDDTNEKAESDHNSDNNEEDNNPEDGISMKSQESEDILEHDSTVSKSAVSEEETLEPPRNAMPNGKKGPCTPPLSPVPVECIFRRGPRTPSLSPPGPRRGPRTPPGVAPTSDSEATDDEGDSSDSSTLSTAY